MKVSKTDHKPGRFYLWFQADNVPCGEAAARLNTALGHAVRYARQSGQTIEIWRDGSLEARVSV